MKYFTIAALMAAAAQAGELVRPVQDNFLWINEQSGLTRVGVKGESHPFDASALQLSASGQTGAKDLKIVPIKFTNPLNSPGNFLRHNWDLIQDCLNDNSDEDAWVDAAQAGYKNVAMTHQYDAGLVQLNGINFEKFDPCESLANDFKRPSGV